MEKEASPDDPEYDTYHHSEHCGGIYDDKVSWKGDKNDKSVIHLPRQDMMDLEKVRYFGMFRR